MIRFPNPGSTIPNMLNIFRTLYLELGIEGSFSLDDFTRVMIKSNLAASSGHIGEKALELSTREDRSRDPLYNQSKMYAEIFRVLGWISSTKDSALDFVFTYLGIHVAISTNPIPLFEESLLGIVYPNKILDNKNDVQLRPFKSILMSLRQLGGFLYRDEMILGPLNIDDNNSTSLLEITNKILKIRENYNFLVDELEKYSNEIGIQINTMQNYTRFPIAALEYVNWIVKERNAEIYNKNLKMMKLTDKGNSVVNRLSSLSDLRLSYLQSLDINLLSDIVYVSFYELLRRAGFDISEVTDEIDVRKSNIEYNLGTRDEYLFSPYQVFDYEFVNTILGFNQNSTKKDVKFFDIENISSDYADINTKVIFVSEEQVKYNNTNNFISQVDELGKTLSFEQLIDHFFYTCQSYKKEDFYNFVGELFDSIGLNCKVTRHGINYERWDAIILNNDDSIPVEIKSPTEELFISVKGVRQAFENKIILLSRKSYTTSLSTTSLLVGNLLPNQRAEVANLIKSIKREFGFKIGVIDLRSLLRLAIQTRLTSKRPVLKALCEMEGYIDVEKL
jgi:hypothetical protein